MNMQLDFITRTLKIGSEQSAIYQITINRRLIDDVVFINFKSLVPNSVQSKIRELDATCHSLLIDPDSVEVKFNSKMSAFLLIQGLIASGLISPTFDEVLKRNRINLLDAIFGQTSSLRQLLDSPHPVVKINVGRRRDNFITPLRSVKLNQLNSLSKPDNVEQPKDLIDKIKKVTL